MAKDNIFSPEDIVQKGLKGSLKISELRSLDKMLVEKTLAYLKKSVGKLQRLPFESFDLQGLKKIKATVKHELDIWDQRVTA